MHKKRPHRPTPKLNARIANNEASANRQSAKSHKFKHLYYPIPETPPLKPNDYVLFFEKPKSLDKGKLKSICVTEAHASYLHLKFGGYAATETFFDEKRIQEFMEYYGAINTIHYDYFLEKNNDKIACVYMDRRAKLTSQFYDTLCRWYKETNAPAMVVVLFYDMINGQPIYEPVPKTGNELLQKEQEMFDIMYDEYLEANGLSKMAA